MQFLLGYDDDKGSFTLEPSNVKARRNVAKNGGFFGKMWVETLDFGFATPKRHFLARNRVV